MARIIFMIGIYFLVGPMLSQDAFSDQEALFEEQKFKESLIQEELSRIEKELRFQSDLLASPPTNEESSQGLKSVLSSELEAEQDVEVLCGVETLIEEMKKNNPKEFYNALNSFNSHLNAIKESAPESNFADINQQCPNGITIIPIAFHLFHDSGSSIGQGLNYSIDKLQKVVDQLNTDFGAFQGEKEQITHHYQQFDAGHTCIQFAIGKVNRIDRSSCQNWSINAIHSQLQYCLPGGSGIGSDNDPNDYLNVYVNEFSGGLLGIASCIPPFFGSCNTSDDGVTINSNVFIPGEANYSAYNRGATLTHEIGHWLGLPHVNGDINGAGCNGDDGFSDTYIQSSQTRYDCDGQVLYSCGTPDNIFNFMDYSQDCAQTMFTLQQAAAMKNVMAGVRNNLAGSFGRGNYMFADYDPFCNATLPNSALRDTIMLTCTGDINFLSYLYQWYPSPYTSEYVDAGLITYMWSDNGVNGSGPGSYFDLADEDFLHDGGVMGDTLIYTLTMNCWDHSTSTYIGGQNAGAVMVVIAPCGAPSNDDCSGAELLTSGARCNDQEYFLIGATPSGVGAFTCGNGGDADYIWFKAEIPSIGALTVETRNSENGITDLILEVYSGICGSLQSIGCDDNSGTDGTHAKVTVLGQNPGDTVYIRVVESGSDAQGAFTLCVTEPLLNDICDDAFELLVSPNCSQLSFHNIGATASNNPRSRLSCSYGSPELPDVWFKTMIPPSGNITIETFYNDDNLDVVMEAYEGSCNSLVPIMCNDDKSNNPFFDYNALISLAGRTPGEVIFVRLTSYGGFSEGQFYICASDNYTPDCSIRLIEKVSQTLCNSDDNTYSLTANVFYDNGISGDLVVNGNRERLSGSPQQVTIDNLMANGQPLSIYGSIVLDGSTNCGIPSYSTDSLTRSEEYCFGGILINDECDGAISLPVRDQLIKSDTFSNTGATYSSYVSPIWQCGSSGPDLDIWFKAIVPEDSTLIIESYELRSSEISWLTSTILEVYTGDCQSLTYVDCNAYGGSSSHSKLLLEHREPGEVLYIRLADQNSDEQGIFGIGAYKPVLNQSCDNPLHLDIYPTCHIDTFDTSNLLTSPIDQDTLSCDLTGNPARDMWFTIEIPESGEFIIQTVSINNEYRNMVMEIYNSDCDALMPLYCDYNSGGSGNAKIHLTGETPGDTLLVRVAPYGGYANGVFGICATEVVDNNACNTSQALSVNAECDSVFFDFHGAFPSGYNNNIFQCGYQAQDPSDLWFSAVVPSSGRLVVETYSEHSLIMEAYRGSCNDLDIIACSSYRSYNTESTNYDSDALIELTDLTPNETIYYRLTIRFGSNTDGIYICAHDSEPIFVDKVLLIESGDISGCDPETNSFTQDFIIHWRAQTVSPYLRMYGPGFYRSILLNNSPDTIKGIELAALGFDMFISARIFSGSINDNYTNSYYHTSGLFQSLESCANTSPENDSCQSAIFLEAKNRCKPKLHSFLGATPSVFQGSRYNCGFYSQEYRDVWFKTIVPTSGNVNIAIYQVDDPGLFIQVYVGGCDNLSYLACDRFNDDVAYDHGNSLLELNNQNPGDTLFIRIGDESNDEQGDFQICVFEPISNDFCTAPIIIDVNSTCIPDTFATYGATVSGSTPVTISCDGSNNPSKDMWFSVEVPSTGGFIIQTQNAHPYPYVNLVMEIYEDDCDQLESLYCDDNSGNRAHPRIVVLNQNPGDTLLIRISTYGGYGNEIFTLCTSDVASNNICADAVELSVGNSCIQDTFDFTTASPSGVNDNRLMCGNTYADDLWFKATVPISGNLVVETFQVEGGANAIYMEAYTDVCSSNMTAIGCSYRKDNNSNQGFIELAEIPPATIVYFRLVSNIKGEFSICANDSPPSQECKILLIEKGVQTSCDPLTNTYSQELVVHYRSEYDEMGITLLSNSYSLNSSPQTITVTDLPAIGGDLSISAWLSHNEFNCYPTSYYYSSDFFSVPENCFGGEVTNDDCIGSIWLEPKDFCELDTFNTTGSAPSLSPLYSYLSCSYNANPVGDVWFKTVVPESGELEIYAPRIHAVEPIIEVYHGSCNSLDMIVCDRFNDEISWQYGLSRAQITNQTPGDTLYIRIGDYGNDDQGEFGICATITCNDYSTIDYSLFGSRHLRRGVAIEFDDSIGAGASIRFSAGDSIILHPGFQVNQGAIFEADLEGCEDD